MKKTLVLAITAAVLLSGAAAQAKKPLVWVWYPNESTPEFAPARSALIEIASKALGREIKEQTTTDYNIAIEAVANNNAAFSWFGGEGYVQAHAKNPKVLPLVTNSPGETLANAKYYSMIAVLPENAAQYKVGGKYSLEALRGKKFSFVSNSSTSGFRVPSTVLAAHFKVTAEDLLEGGPGKVFSQVMFGGSHQGSYFNLLSGKADAAVFCNECVFNYADWNKANYNDPAAGEIVVVKAKADAPFDTVPGKEVVLIATVPVLNAPIIMNTALLTADEVAKLKAAFTSDAVRNDPRIFAPKDSTVKSFFRGGQRFLLVEDAWYDPIRKLSGMK
jgi:phosphonate transport system substrate-binding protein